MSLVGSELDISVDTGYGSRSGKTKVALDDDVDDNEEISVPDDSMEQCVMDCHPPPSPPRPAEHLFLSNLNTQNISAAALAQQIHMSLRSPWSSRRGASSVATDDFVTAHGSIYSPKSTSCEDDDDDADDYADIIDNGFDLTDTLPPIVTSTTYNSDLSSPSNNTNYNYADDEDDAESSIDNDNHVFAKDVHSRNYRYLITPEEELEFLDATSMSTASPATKQPPAAAAAVSTPPPVKQDKFFPTEAPAHTDAAEKVYDTAKGVWAWGKGVTVISPFLGIAETVAGKAVSMAGHSLENIDGEVVKQLHGIDDGILNPAIEKIVGILLAAAGKSEDVLKPILVALLKPFGLIKESAENPEQTPVAGVAVTIN